MHQPTQIQQWETQKENLKVPTIYFISNMWHCTFLHFLCKFAQYVFCCIQDNTHPQPLISRKYIQRMRGNKMPTRCKRGFYCRSYCLLNMFRAPLCPSSGARECYTVVAACGISCCGFQVAGLVMCPVCRMLQHPANRTHNPQLHTRPATWKPQHEIPQAATTV